MKLLIVGGAGYVGSIVVPTFEKEFECTYFDIKPVPGHEDRTILADVGDEEKVRQAVAGVDAILYLAMGNEIKPAFDVNVCGLYRFLYISLKAGMKHFVYASTLSVYNNLGNNTVFDENRPANTWSPYGLSKRVGEFICGCAAQAHDSACIIALRLILPCNENDWPKFRYDSQKPRNSCATGPNDIRRLFLAAVNFDRPGFHLIQASGDMEGKFYSNKRASEVLGWLPKNE
ncbi:MAG: N-acetyl-alpha-D-glucosaminyl-diphospho-ditrans,octacis-undecaprenol 4-epimerase [Firmicutes bacterium]|nr:N-acetyl-alpha-D-glucosaminyl-diphospho-ditrans,octacis-undecaprenol 4-epimerase [Bacillota bacterium]